MTLHAKPILPWMGGKRRLAKQILPIFQPHQAYVEPFCGGAALFFMKEPSPVEVINDAHGELINLYRIVKHHLEELVKQFRWGLVSREEYLTQREIEPRHLTDIQRAARFFYLQKLAFGGRVEGQTFGTSAVSPPRLNLLRIEEDLSAAHLRLSRTLIEHLDWAECISRYDRPGTLFYLDPPYWGTAGYGVDFGLEQYDRMAQLAHDAKGQVVISVNDIPEMHAAFEGLSIRRTTLRYQNGKQATEPRGELIISNR
ncbi:DNA adenine methylase [Kushneria phosphatilytica]|uniref:site-specific DNA-methyltransferase (adenine-specific) n=1 Tax=Kushneria phosphatilytica TaxID=657387 RepID=A0A1S1NXS5_9GAMM|nr:DNA adenine methylase [Kushneria phosphatilytica]OHV11213.1 restriction endonuclease subunit M [Kushneria phosphatilytica]QEL12214.1 DNA adenine methylase [Kushneria phosphatilytica]